MKRDAVGGNRTPHGLTNVQFASTIASSPATVARGEFTGHAIHQSFEPGHLAVIYIAEFQFRQGLVQQILGRRARMNQVGALHAITNTFAQLFSQRLNGFKSSRLALFELNRRFAKRLVTQCV